MLKCLCGLAVSGQVRLVGIDDGRIWRPPAWWIRCLFGVAALPAEHGLYFRGEPGERVQERGSFAFAGMSTRDGPYGLIANIANDRFVFAMTKHQTRDDSLLQPSVYRPLEFVHSNGINTSVLKLGWEDPTHRTTVSIEHDNPRMTAAVKRR